MKIILKNIGPFTEEQEIEMNGITVLAGKNGTGKSTFGKVLYCFFSAFHDVDNQILLERKNAITRRVFNYYGSHFDAFGSKEFSRIKKVVLDAFNDDDPYDTDIEGAISEIMSSIDDSESKERLEELKKECNRILKLNKEEILEIILSKMIDAEFGGQLVNLNYMSKEAYARLIIKDKEICFKCNGNSVTINESFPLVKDIIYIDDPNTIDSLDIPYYQDNIVSHKSNLKRKLRFGNNSSFTSVDQLLAKERIKSIEEKINAVCDGDVVNRDGRGFKYVSNQLKEGLNLSNMATGLKSFAILKEMLKKGYLEENGIIVFDEPEIHLHPEWQRAWAEIIVLLHKDLGINVLLSTHSSDFIGFMELFKKKYGVEGRCKAYLLNKGDSLAHSVKDVGNSWDKIYDQLGKPFISAAEEIDALDD